MFRFLTSVNSPFNLFWFIYFNFSLFNQNWIDGIGCTINLNWLQKSIDLFSSVKVLNKPLKKYIMTILLYYAKI